MNFDYRQHQRKYRELDTVRKQMDQIRKTPDEELDSETFAALLNQALDIKMSANQLLTTTQALTNYRADQGKIVFDGIP